MKNFLREHLQLMELLICIFFFMAGSLMAGSLFIRASQIENASQELQSAVEVVQQQAENLRISNEICNDVLYYDTKWQACTESEHVYRLDIEKRSEHTAVISVYHIKDKKAELIYSVEAGGAL